MTDHPLDGLEAMLTRLDKIPQWNQEKHELRRAISGAAEELGLYRFKSRAEFFALSRLPHIGETVVLSVPGNHRGKLKNFCGKTVKIICIGNAGANDREMIAYEIDVNR